MSAVNQLAPEVRAWLRRAAEISAQLPDLGGAPGRHRAAALQLSDLLAEEFTQPVPDGVLIHDIELPGGVGMLRARVFRPDGAPSAAPTMLWCHGGGFIGGTIDEKLNDRTSAALARGSGVQIVSLEYRLAPEHPFPAPVDDVIAAFDQLRRFPDDLGIDPHRLGLGGNSAGAMIVATASQRLRDAGVRPCHLALEVLPAALRPIGDSFAEYGVGFGLDDAFTVAELYRGDASLREISPLDAADLRDLPPTLLMISEYDPLRDGALAYRDALCASGVDVVSRVGAGHLHGTPGITALWEGARDWRDVFAALVRAAYLPELTR